MVRQEDLQQRLELVRAYEEDFAYRLGRVVVNKPKLNIWILLVPILLIYHFQEIRRFKENLPGFIHGFTRSKLLALREAAQERAAEAGIGPEVAELPGVQVEAAGADPAAAAGAGSDQQEAIGARQEAERQVLKEHYRLLLDQSGEDYPALLRGGYPERAAYEGFLGRLQQAESDLYQVLQAQLPPDSEELAVISRLEREALRLRREEVRRLFP